MTHKTAALQLLAEKIETLEAQNQKLNKELRGLREIQPLQNEEEIRADAIKVFLDVELLHKTKLADIMEYINKHKLTKFGGRDITEAEALIILHYAFTTFRDPDSKGTLHYARWAKVLNENTKLVIAQNKDIINRLNRLEYVQEACNDEFKL